MDLKLEYFLFAFIACCGVLQIAATYARLKGLCFLPRGGYLLGFLLLLGAFWWFFATEDRNVRGLEGGQQLGLFNGAMFAALFFSLLLSSLLRLGSRRREAPRGGKGLEALKERTYLEALLLTLRALFRFWGGGK